MERRGYDHCSRTKAHQVYPARSTQFLLHALRMCRVQLDYSGASENPSPMAQAWVTVASQRAQTLRPVPVVREQQPICVAVRTANACSKLGESACPLQQPDVYYLASLMSVLARSGGFGGRVMERALARQRGVRKRASQDLGLGQGNRHL